MAGKIVEIAVMEGIAALLFYFAWAIGVKQRMYFIAGYNERSAQTVRDKPGLARLIGRLCLVVGVASALMPVGTTVWGHTSTGFASLTGGYCGVIVGVCAFAMLQARDYARSPLAEKRRN